MNSCDDNVPNGNIIFCLLFGIGEVSNDQYTLECTRELIFQEGTSTVCHIYNISQDNVCELEGKLTYFQLRLSLTSTVGLRLGPSVSAAMVNIDDTREPECCESLRSFYLSVFQLMLPLGS